MLGRQKESRRCQQKGQATASGDRISERFLIQFWQCLPDRTDLTTEEGEPVHLVYPGRENDDRGADLRDAVILFNQGLTKGDIEFHLWSADWRKHHHHRDPSYNGTILHVVMWRGTELATQLQSGKKIPILVLSKLLEKAGRRRVRTGYPADTVALPCYQYAKSLPIEKIDEILDAAGRERFLVKAATFQSELSRDTSEQILYQGIMVALGYVKNKLPFQELAGRVPLHHLEAMVRRYLPDDECLARQQAWLFGTAGLLPSQRGIPPPLSTDDPWVESLENYWSEYAYCHGMSADCWRLVKVRPYNYPVRRIAGISYLLLRHRQEGLLEEILNLIREIEIDQAYCALEGAMMVMSSGYWETHYDFDCYCRDIAPALIGNDRAAAIAVNVILPFAYAWGICNAQLELVAKSMAIFTTYPKLGTNAIERHMSRQLGRSSVPINWAQRQQGLIHIYKTLCTQGKCAVCPLGMGTKYRTRR